MAQSVNACKNNIRQRLGLLLVLGFAASTAIAENLPDPTRPSGAAYADENAGSLVSGPVLQSVLTSSGRKLAIINGQTVKQGDAIGNLRVEKIGDTEVVLARGKEVQVLRLFPAVEKRPSTVLTAPKNGMRQ